MEQDIKNDINIAALTEEYILLQKLIDLADIKALNVKTWSVTISASGIGAAFISHSPIIFVLSGLSAVIFWLMEYRWKKYQHAHFARIFEIEEYLNKKKDNNKEFYLFQISTSWKKSFRSINLKRDIKIITYYNVMIPHLFILFISIILYVLSLYNIIKI